MEQERTGRLQAWLGVLPTLAAVLTALIAVLSAWQSQTQYTDSQAATRFQSAVEMLAGEDLTTRVGGIALLGEVGRESEERRDPAMRLLATFLRVHFPVTEEGRQAAVTLQPAGEEVRAVFAALMYRGEVDNVDLGRISARNLTLSAADLSGLIFARSDLSGSMLEGVNLSGAILRETSLREVNFSGADLRGADFTKADLSGTNLKGADLRGANLKDAQGVTEEMLSAAVTDGTTTLP
ncbi:pentapeptide repeat-containing protein [Deinococcus sp. SL84]|uniref:pentapeptide repeat-containing protein n=1 Tax=Deinococcus sp. SL84 TaxID=2994663 RepID=UPI002274D48A|nr:pentapeptide repeat-containing protein [Deinococcus sp. SL84]MCY1704326.1 pentapeptide repeat-containing protein [Deinococcus sp. SL84]